MKRAGKSFIMLFKKINGHTNVLSKIEKDIGNDEFSGAYLFTGPNSVGKYSVAKYIAKYLTCSGVKDDSCRCENCRQFPNVPDYYEVTKGTDTITVDNVSSITDFFQLKSFRGGYRVTVIDNAHNLNTSAANRLLKILEDIPPQCLIILVTSSPEKLLSTIVSRCYTINFRMPKQEELLDILRKNNIDSNNIADLYRMSNQISGSIISDCDRYSNYLKITSRFLKEILSAKEDTIIDFVKDIQNKGDLDIFMDSMYVLINDIFKLRHGSPDIVCNIKNIDFLEELTQRYRDEICILILDKIRGIRDALNKKVNMNIDQLFKPMILWLYYFLHKDHK